jgi:hypothetical protein
VPATLPALLYAVLRIARGVPARQTHNRQDRPPWIPMQTVGRGQHRGPADPLKEIGHPGAAGLVARTGGEGTRCLRLGPGSAGLLAGPRGRGPRQPGRRTGSWPVPPLRLLDRRLDRAGLRRRPPGQSCQPGPRRAGDRLQHCRSRASHRPGNERSRRPAPGPTDAGLRPEPPPSGCRAGTAGRDAGHTRDGTSSRGVWLPCLARSSAITSTQHGCAPSTAPST